MLAEILIHISAPSRVQDDSRYRKQAEGYLGFRAARRHDLGKEINASSSGPQADEPSTNLPAAGTSHNIDTATTTDESSCSSSEDRAEDDKSSPAPIDFGVEITFDNRSFFRLDLTPTQSRSYLSALVANGNTRTPTVYVERTPTIERPRTAPTQVWPVVRFNQHQRSHSESWQPLPSVVPDSQPSGNSLKRDLPQSTSFSSSTQSVSPLAKRQRLQVGDPTSVGDPPSSSGSLLPYKRTSSQHDLSQIAPTSSPWSGLTSQRPVAEIHPPPPATSIAAFGTHISSALTVIESKLPLQDYFRPSHTTRSLGVLERGHWQLKIDKDWPLELREKCWSFLQKLIGEGRAGWGVWCERYADRWEATSAGENLAENVVANAVDRTRESRGRECEASPGNELVRVYCWGEVVPHLYLVLFMATDRRIKGQGAAWIDASGKEVIKMV